MLKLIHNLRPATRDSLAVSNIFAATMLPGAVQHKTASGIVTDIRDPYLVLPGKCWAPSMRHLRTHSTFPATRLSAWDKGRGSKKQLQAKLLEIWRVLLTFRLCTGAVGV